MIQEEDLRIDMFRSGAATVKVTHLPTGLNGIGTHDGGSSIAARDLALAELLPKLREARVEFPPAPAVTERPTSTFEELVRLLND